MSDTSRAAVERLIEELKHEYDKGTMLRPNWVGIFNAIQVLEPAIHGLLDERDAAQAQVAERKDLTHELLDLITLMPDSQTDEIVAYITQLMEARRAR